MSMAVNMSEFCPERLGELDPELEDIEDRELEAEIDQLAEARAIKPRFNSNHVYLYKSLLTIKI